MLPFSSIDLLVRGGSIALLILWSWVVWRDHGRMLAARLAIAMNAAIICHVVATIPGPPSYATPLDWLIELGGVSVPGLFWLFARAWFDDEPRVGWKAWLLIALSLALVHAQILHYQVTGQPQLLLAVVLRTMMFGFAAAGLWSAWRGREGDLVESRRRLRGLLIWSVGVFVLLTNGIEVAVWAGWLPDISRNLIEFGILALIFYLFGTMMTLRETELFGAASSRVEPLDTPRIDDPLANRLLTHMEVNKPHRDETLTIAGLATQLGVQEYQLRRLINGTLGHRNFAAFLNGYRLAEVKAALADSTQKDVPILTIALDAGFGSLGPFNRAFREAEGMTPSAFRNKMLTQSRKAAKEGL